MTTKAEIPEEALREAMLEVMAEVGQPVTDEFAVQLARTFLAALSGYTLVKDDGEQVDRDAARAEYDQLKRDPDFISAVTDETHPGHAVARAKRLKLLGRIFKKGN